MNTQLQLAVFIDALFPDKTHAKHSVINLPNNCSRIIYFKGHFGLVFVHPYNENGFQFWDSSTLNTKNNLNEKRIFVKTLQNGVSESQHVFNIMKDELRRAKNTNIIIKNSNSFVENKMDKRETNNQQGRNPSDVCLENDDSQYADVSKSDLITKLDKMTVKYDEIKEKLITLLQQTCFLDRAEPKVKAKLKLIKIWGPKRILNETDQEILKDISEHCINDLLSGGSDTKYKSFPGSDRIDILGLNYG